MKKLMALILAGIISVTAVAAVSAEEDAPAEPERAAGVVFTAESGYHANTYTGYVGGLDNKMTVGQLLDRLENKNGIEVRRGDTVVGNDEDVQHGDKLVLVAEDGTVSAEFSLIYMGNANKDSKVNISDASAMLKKIAKWDVDVDAVAADVNGDGTVNVADVSLFLKVAAKWNEEFVKHPVLPGKIKTEVIGNVPCFKNPGAQGWAPITLSDGVHYDLATKFNVAEGQYAAKLSFLCHSMSDDKGSLTFSVYKWAGDYDTTVAAMPIISEKRVDYKDNSLIDISLKDTSGKGLAEGEYMWRIHEGYDDPDKAVTGVGVYFYPNLAPEESTGMKTFLNCKEFNIGPVVQMVYERAK